MDAVNVIVGKVVDVLFTPIGHHLSYLFRYKDNLTNLRKKVEDLKDVRQRMQGRIYEAERKGDTIEAGVRRWINDVDAMITQVETFLASEEDAANKIACFNLRPHYSSSREATKKTFSVTGLYDKSDKFDTVSRAAPLPGINAHLSKNIDGYESQKSAMKQIMDALKDNEIHIVGVCGMGGVGKTTLVTELGKRVKASKDFDEAVMAVVSQPIDTNKIQDHIARHLGMDAHALRGDGEQRRGKLWDRIMKGKRILLILDDLWDKVDLENLGIPAGDRDRNQDSASCCNIILTSRNEDVCNRTGAQKIIPVTPMPDEEAWMLFKQVAGNAIDNNRDLNSIAKKVFKECRGLPISILAVGNALKNKKKQEWNDALHQLKVVAPHHVNPFLKEVYPKLKLSYDSLENKVAKRCFLLCSLFPEDYDVPVESLATYGIGLRLFEGYYGSSLEDARRGARSAVSVLKTSYLLLDGRDDDYVKMHDVIRDVAIAIGSEDGEDDMFMAQAATGLREWPEMPSYKNYTGISLMDNNISEVPAGLKCPKLQILLLQNNPSLSTIPDDLVQETKELKVIDLQDCAIRSFPRSLVLLTTLHTLRLDGSRLQDISMLGGLAGLEILGLSSTDVVKIPEQIGKLTNLRLLDMRDCNSLEYVAPGVISSLGKLEDLYIHRGISYTLDRGNSRKLVSLAELNSLPKIKNLEISVPHTELVHPIQMNLQFQSLQRFMIILGNTTFSELNRFRDIYNPHISLLYVALNMEVPLLGWIKTLIKAAAVLILNKINDLSASDIDVNKVRSLEITECVGVSSLAVTDMSDLNPKPIFCSIRRLVIENLPNLTAICHSQLLTGESFRKLEDIKIYSCHKIMSTVLGFNLLLALQNLSRLDVRGCSSVEYILGAGICMEEGLGLGETKFLPALTELVLFELPILVDIWNIVHNSKFIRLGKLKDVYIDKCFKLRRLFPSTLVNHLVSLEILSEYSVLSITGTHL